jgi:hypothetical protein
MKSLRQAIGAGVPRKILRDGLNWLRYWPDPPLSDELIWIDPKKVTHWYKPDPANGAPKFRRRHSGKVVGGDWDLSRKPFDAHLKLNSVRAHYQNGVPWPETELFQRLLQKIEAGQMVDGCRSREDLVERYNRLDQIYDEAKRLGTLRPHGSVNDTRREHGGILVHIARDGTPLRDGGGMHRFALAVVLDLPLVPAQLGVIHPDAVKAGVLDTLRRPPKNAIQASDK